MFTMAGNYRALERNMEEEKKRRTFARSCKVFHLGQHTSRSVRQIWDAYVKFSLQISLTHAYCLLPSTDLISSYMRPISTFYEPLPWARVLWFPCWRTHPEASWPECKILRDLAKVHLFFPSMSLPEDCTKLLDKTWNDCGVERWDGWWVGFGKIKLGRKKIVTLKKFVRFDGP